MLSDACVCGLCLPCITSEPVSVAFESLFLKILSKICLWPSVAGRGPYPRPSSHLVSLCHQRCSSSIPSSIILLCPPHKLNLSQLLPSKLLSLLTTPILKYLSSPAAVLPPTYHFSLPIVSRQCVPSLLLSLPLLLPVCECGVVFPLSRVAASFM